MTKESYTRATYIIEQIDKLNSLSKKIGIEYRKSTDEDLKDFQINLIREVILLNQFLNIINNGIVVLLITFRSFI